MSRQKSPIVAQRVAALGQRIRELKAEHSFWGSRCIWAYLHFVEQLPVNKQRVLRLMRAPQLLSSLTCGSKPHARPRSANPNPPNCTSGGVSIGPRCCSRASARSIWWWSAIDPPRRPSATMPAARVLLAIGSRRWTWRSTASSRRGYGKGGCP